MDCFSPDHPLTRALVARGYADLTPVQAAVLGADAMGRDLLVSAQTGSGKTVAYGLALADTLLGEAPALEPAGRPLALVIAPTRELALQVQGELSWLYEPAGGQLAACVGGMDPRAEARRLHRGVHIVVGTPGRLRDHLERRALDLSALRAVVLDEADEMLDMGFREDLEFLLDAMPADRQTLLFSATLPREIEAMARRYQQGAHRIAVEAPRGGHTDIEHKAVLVAPNEIGLAVVNLLRFHEAPTAMVFCGTREAVNRYQAGLQERGFGVVALSGELSQAERNRALQALRDGRARVCVATDVAARGIDLPSLDLVIHAELPRTAETLQHRSGRTGRAGRKGTSVLLVPLSRRRRAESLLRDAGVEGKWDRVPTAEDIRALDQQRFLDHPVLNEQPGEDELAMARVLLGSRSPEQIAVALVRLQRAQLPAAEEVSALDATAPARGRRQDVAPHAERPAHQPRPERSQESRPHESRSQEPRSQASRSQGPMVWFRLNIGSRKKGDPRWLLPLICRQGRISKPDIGLIRVLDHETRFEVDARVADSFLATLRQVQNPEGRIEPLAAGDLPGQEGPAPADRQARPETRRFEGRPARHTRPAKPHGGKPGWKPKEHRAAARG